MPFSASPHSSSSYTSSSNAELLRLRGVPSPTAALIPLHRQEPFTNNNTAHTSSSEEESSHHLPSRRPRNMRAQKLFHECFGNSTPKNEVAPDIPDATASLPYPEPSESFLARAQQAFNIHYTDVLQGHVQFASYAIDGSEFDLSPEQMRSDQSEDLENDRRNRGETIFKFRRDPDRPKPVVVYVGGQGLTPTRNVVWNLFTAIGVFPLRVAIGKIKKNQRHKTTSPMCMVELKNMEDANKAIACLDRRVLLDQIGFYIAQNQDEVERITAYTQLLKFNKKFGKEDDAGDTNNNNNNETSKEAEARSPFMHRPHSLVTVTLEGKNGANDNVRNPLCKNCQECSEFYKRFADFQFLNEKYIRITHGQLQNDDEGGVSNLPSKLILTHAFRDKTNLTRDEDIVYCDVSAHALQACREAVAKCWPFWKYVDLALSRRPEAITSQCRNALRKNASSPSAGIATASSNAQNDDDE